MLNRARRLLFRLCRQPEAAASAAVDAAAAVHPPDEAGFENGFFRLSLSLSLSHYFPSD